MMARKLVLLRAFRPLTRYYSSFAQRSLPFRLFTMLVLAIFTSVLFLRTFTNAAPHPMAFPAGGGAAPEDDTGDDIKSFTPWLPYYGPNPVKPLPRTPHCDINLNASHPDIWAHDLMLGPCKENILLFAKGSINPGNVGTTVGPCFVRDIKRVRPDKFMIQGIDYEGALSTFVFGGSNQGAKDIADKIWLANRKCPGSNVVLSGYSQGAQIIHKAVEKYLDKGLHHVVKAIVLFGDPKNGTKFPGTLNNNVKYFCHKGDHFCKNIIWDSKEHHTYRDDTGIAADWVDSVLPGRVEKNWGIGKTVLKHWNTNWNGIHNMPTVNERGIAAKA